MIYKTLIKKLTEIIDTVNLKGDSFAYPVQGDEITKNPAIIYYPSDLTSELQSNNTNLAEYTFDLWILIQVSGLQTKKKIFTDIMPDVADEVIEKINQGWAVDSGNCDNMFLRIESGNWGIEVGDRGETAFSNYKLIFKVLDDFVTLV